MPLSELHGAEIYLGLVVVFQTLTTVLPFVRFYLLRHRRRTILCLASDGFYILSVGLGVGFGWTIVAKAVQEVQVRKQYTAELLVLSKIATTGYMKLAFVNSLMYLTMIYCVKAAFLCFYWGLFTSVQKARRWGLYVTAVAIPVCYITVNIVYLTDCSSISDNWNIKKLIYELALCSPTWDLRPQAIAAALSVTTDLMLLAVPLTLLGSLDLTSLERRVLPIIFAIGIVSLSAPLVRFFVLQSRGAYEVAKGSQRFSMDKLHWVEFFSIIEVFAGQVAFCMPSFRMILAKGFWGAMRGRITRMTVTLDPTGIKKSQNISTSKLRSATDGVTIWADADERGGMTPEPTYQSSRSFIRVRHEIELAERESMEIPPPTYAYQPWK